MTGRGADTFSYGARGELVSATVGATTVTYAYDEVGRRVARTQGAATEQYLYLDPDDPWRVSASKAGGVTTMYRYDDDGRLVGLERSGTTYVVGTDQAGSVRLVADASTGTVVRATTYTAFGVPTTTTNTLDLPIGFAGGLQDPLTGLVRVGVRDYDPQTGRFTARDPALFAGGQFNLYAYADGDPVGGRDPSGLGDGPMYGPGGPPPSQPPGYCGADPTARKREVALWDAMLNQAAKKFERTPDGPERDKLERKVKDLWKTTHKQATEDSMPPPDSDGKPTSAAAFASSGAATKA
jgi:RHS repeat-associated protein